MKYTLLLEDENGNKTEFNNNPETVKLIAENIDFDTMEGVMGEFLPKSISEPLFEALNTWNRYQSVLHKLRLSAEPRTVFVNEKDWGDGAVLSEKCYLDKTKAERHSEVLDSSYIRTVKFQEVIE